MTISSTSSQALYNNRPQAPPALDSTYRERFGGLLGLSPDSFTSSLATAGVNDSVEISSPARQASAAPAAVLPPPAPAATVPKPMVVDRPEVTLPAGTVVDGMVSAGPLSPGLTSMTGVLPAVSGTRLISVAPDAANFGYDPIAMIRDRLAKIGVNSNAIQFERWNDNIQSPGGNRTNQYVRGTLANGMSENFAVERVLQNPDITATEIQTLMNFTKA